MAHDCYETFWGDAAALYSHWLDLILPGDARKMSKATYEAFCSVQMTIENATGRPNAAILPHVGGGTAWTDADEAFFRALGQTFLDGLVADQFDVADGHHTTVLPGWILTGEPEIAPHNAVAELVGVGPGLPAMGGGGLLGRIKNVLGP